jgi:glutathionylspermidine synthase
VRREIIAPRPDWRAKVEDLGLTWHTTETGEPYWDESAYWRFEMAEIDHIEAATGDLYDMVLDAVGHAIEQRQLAAFGYGPEAIALIEKSWEGRTWEPTLYGRFDLAYDGRELKMLEFNGDTPTSLLEAAVVQWFWLQERFPELDQFNSIHEKLIEAFTLYAEHGPKGPLHLASVQPHLEDEGTVGYLAACAAEAGLNPLYTAIQDIGVAEDGAFVDGENRVIEALFKLYPWEWLLEDEFGPQLSEAVLSGRLKLIEPAWKMVASNKRLLVTLHARNSDHPLLLRASSFESDAKIWGDYVRKPVRGREGANVTLVRDGLEVAKRGGAYEDDLFVFQERANLARADAGYAVLGSWVANRQACGLGVREAASLITDNTARFVPHLIG